MYFMVKSKFQVFLVPNYVCVPGRLISEWPEAMTNRLWIPIFFFTTKRDPGHVARMLDVQYKYNSSY